MSRPQRRARALAILREGRCTILHARTAPDGTERPVHVIGRVQGHQGTYAVDNVDGIWDCTCGKPECAHLLAVQLVTGGAS